MPRNPISGAFAATLLVAAGASCLACASTGPGSPGVAGAGSPAALAAARPDDSDLPSLVPVGARLLIDLRLDLLRDSPWTREALAPQDAAARATKAAALGYDDSTDVDRMVYAVIGADATRPTLVVAQGRLSQESVVAAFRTRWPGAVVATWRKLSLVVSEQNAVAFITPRTFVSGAPDDVRAVIDRAYGLGEPLDADPGLGPLRRELLGTVAGPVAHPAVMVLSTLDPVTRARLGELLSTPIAMTRLGLRMDLGRSLALSAIAVAADPRAASEVAQQLMISARRPGTRLLVAAIGLSPILDNVRATSDGARVRVTSVAEENDRAAIGEALKSLLRLIRQPG